MVKKEAKKVVLKDAEGNYIVPVIDPADKGGGYTPNIFDTKWSDHLQNDIRWLRGDTFSWQPGKVYEAAYNKLVQEYDATTSVVTVNANKVGAVTLSDTGVASDFSASAYLQKAITLPASRTSVFPMVFNVTTGGDITTEQYVAAIDSWCMQLSIGTDSKFHLYLGSGTSWDIANGTAGQTVLSANTNYELILDYDGSEYTLQVITNGSTPTVVNDIVLASSTMVCTGSKNLYIGTNGGHTIPFLGKISVPGCSIDDSWHGTFSKTSKNGFIILDGTQEQYAAQKFADEGVAWYYILANQRFKLPRTSYGFNGVWGTVGEDKVTTFQSGTGASLRATQMYCYFYVGDFEEDAVKNTAGLNAELFAEKLDKNLSNLDAVGQAILDRKVEVEALLEQNGYAKFTWKEGNKTSILFQWGSFSAISLGSKVSFPTVFAQLLTVNYTNTDSRTSAYYCWLMNNPNNNGFIPIARSTTGSGYTSTGYYLAVGI